MSKVKVLILSLVVAFALGLAFVYYQLVLSPWRGKERFCKVWVERLQTIHAPEDIPSEWRDTVYVRRFSDGWIAAAMNHGSCTSTGGKGGFNATVLKDSNGQVIVLPNYSPCAPGIQEIGKFWEALYPAESLSEFYEKYGNPPKPKG
jgi:hypothetical protein